MRSTGQISLNFGYHVNTKIFISNCVCVFTNKKRKHIEQNFHSIGGVMPQGWDVGVLGESKGLAWGFAMAPHRLRILVLLLWWINLSLRWDVSSVSAITLDVPPENSFQVETTSVPPQTFSKFVIFQTLTRMFTASSENILYVNLCRLRKPHKLKG